MGRVQEQRTQSSRPGSQREAAHMRKEQRQRIRRRKQRQRRRLCLRLLLLALLCVLLYSVVTTGRVLPDNLVSWAKEFSSHDGTGEIGTALGASTGEYPEGLLEALEHNPELAEFVKGYPDAEKKASGGLTAEELQAAIPQLLQYDKRWGYAPYGDDCIALSGCAPACLSMVIIGLTGDATITPATVADFADEQGYYAKGVGTQWSLMTEGCKHFGITGEEISLDQNKIVSLLEEGTPIICSMRPGDFTTTGHFIVLTAVTGDGIRVHDPFSQERSDQSWDYATLERQIKNLWAFYKE